GSSRDLAKECAPRMKHAFVVVGGQGERHHSLIALLQAANIGTTTVSVTGEPTFTRADEWAALAKDARCDGVVSIGGGSVIDAGKAVAALVANPGGALRYVEVIGQGAPLSQPSLPHVALPTTAGTGAQV